MKLEMRLKQPAYVNRDERRITPNYFKFKKYIFRNKWLRTKYTHVY